MVDGRGGGPLKSAGKVTVLAQEDISALRKSITILAVPIHVLCNGVCVCVCVGGGGGG
jgi:hypothetical protein